MTCWIFRLFYFILRYFWVTILSVVNNLYITILKKCNDVKKHCIQNTEFILWKNFKNIFILYPWPPPPLVHCCNFEPHLLASMRLGWPKITALPQTTSLTKIRSEMLWMTLPILNDLNNFFFHFHYLVWYLIIVIYNSFNKDVHNNRIVYFLNFYTCSERIVDFFKNVQVMCLADSSYVIKEPYTILFNAMARLKLIYLQNISLVAPRIKHFWWKLCHHIMGYKSMLKSVQSK